MITKPLLEKSENISGELVGVGTILPSKNQSLPPTYVLTFWIPDILDLLEVLRRNGIKDKYHDRYAYVINTIYLMKVINKKQSKDEYVNLNSKTLEEMLTTKKARFILKLLIKEGIIETDNSWRKGAKSKGYRLCDTYRNISFKKIIVHDNLIIRKMNNFKQRQKNESELAGADYSHLYNCLQKIEINYLGAIEYLNECYVPFTDDYDTRKVAIELIHIKDLFFIIDNKGRRAHTNLTNLASDLRKFITYNGKTLGQVDLKNSQPFLFNLLIKDRINQRNQVQVNEYKNYKELTEQGKFYEYLMKGFGVEQTEEKRKQFKEVFFGRVFFDMNRKKLKKEEAQFKALFPTIFAIIRDYKAKDYTNLAVKLQRAESNVIISECIRTIRIDRQNMFVSTIHDSIVCELENLGYVQKVIEEAFIKHNLKPSCKQEIF